MENLRCCPRPLPLAALAMAMVLMSGCCLPPLGKPACPLCGHGNSGSCPAAGKLPAGAAATTAASPIVAAGHQVRDLPEHMVRLFERLHAVEDDRKAMRARMEAVEGQLEEKEESLVQATKDIKAATEEIDRTRLEVLRGKNEVLGLRKRLGTLERENKETLESIIRTLEHLLEREKLQPREPKLPDVPRLP